MRRAPHTHIFEHLVPISSAVQEGSGVASVEVIDPRDRLSGFQSTPPPPGCSLPPVCGSFYKLLFLLPRLSCIIMDSNLKPQPN